MFYYHRHTKWTVQYFSKKSWKRDMLNSSLNAHNTSAANNKSNPCKWRSFVTPSLPQTRWDIQLQWHWGQRESYLAGKLRVCWEFLNNLLTLCPAGKLRVLLKLTHHFDLNKIGGYIVIKLKMSPSSYPAGILWMNPLGSFTSLIKMYPQYVSGQSRLLHTMTKESVRPGRYLCDELCPGSASPRFCVTARGQEEGGRWSNSNDVWSRLDNWVN